MNNYTVTKDRDGSYVVLDPWGFAVRQPGSENKVRSEQLPIVFRTEVAALAAAAKFQRAEEERSRQKADAESKNSKDRIARTGAESDYLRQAREERNNLASATAKVRELTGEIVDTERLVRDLNSTISSLEGRLEVSKIDLSAARQKLNALRETLAKAKGESK